ncbi:MAG: glycosyltransferase family 4 protein [Burkholderiales bacterium]
MTAAIATGAPRAGPRAGTDGPGEASRAPRYRVLLVHNYYQQRGGEDAVVEAEEALLRAHGHEVRLYARRNDEIGAMSALRAARDALWSRRTVREIGAEIAAFRPDLVHAHNTFPLISPSLCWAVGDVPLVQTLHNFRLLCPQAMFLRNGAVCEDCLGRLPWRGALHRCYRASLPQSAAVAAMIGVHRTIGSFAHKVALYLAPSAFCRDKLIAGGLPAERIAVKPHFVDVAPPAEGARRGGLFVGRLAAEKGLDVLARALDEVPEAEIAVVGDGPESPRVRAHPRLRALGRLPRAEVLAMMRRAAYLVMPSICFETFGLAALEAFASGLPVIASRTGGLADLVEDGRTGLLVAPGSAGALRDALRWAHSHADALAQMGRNARATYERGYTGAANHELLMAAYARARNTQDAGNTRRPTQ